MRGRRLFAALAAGSAVAGLMVVGAITGSTSAVAVTPTQPGAFVGMTPANLLDTGSGVAPNTAVTFQVTGRAGVPASIGSVQLVIGIVTPAATGFATAYAAGTQRPLAASLDFTANQTTANAVVVGVSSAGQVSIFNGSTAAVRIVANVNGYYLPGTAATPGAFTAVPPASVLDTAGHVGVPAPAGNVPPNGSVTFAVAGQGGVPASNVGAVALLIGVATPGASGFATVYPAGTTRPGAASLNFLQGQTNSNLTEVGLGTGGSVTIFNGSNATVRFVANVFGYYQAGPPVQAGMFGSVQPANLLDTGTGVGAPAAPVAANSSVTIQVTGRGGVPTNAGAVALIVGVANAASSGYVTVYPADVLRPGSASFDFNANQTSSGLVVAQLSASGRVTLFNGSTSAIRLVANVTGYWTANPDTTAPNPVSDLTSTSLSPTSVELFWHNPSDVDFAGVKVCTTSGSNCSGTTVGAASNSLVVQSLAAGSTSTFTVFALDTAGNVSDGMSTTVTTPASGNTASISGSVTDVTTPTHPLGSVIVRVYTTTASPVAGAVTAADGAYTVGGLAAGSYKVCFDGRFATGGGAATGLYQDRCFTNVAWPNPAAGAPSGATTVTLTAGSSSSGVNAALPAAGGVTGTVTEANFGSALGNVRVFAYPVGPTAVAAGTALTAADGTYTLRHLPPAASGYIVCFAARDAVGPPFVLGYADRCYQNFQWDETVASPYGNAVFVGTGTAPTGATDSSATVTTGINVALPRAAVLNGRVTADGVNAANVPVTVWDTNGRVIARATTASDGTWQAFPVSPGTVLVCFDASNVTAPSTFGYQSQCYNGKPWDGTSRPTATGISLTPGNVVNNVNAALVQFPSITGTVTDSTNHAPLFNVTVKLFNTSGIAIKTTTTMADGTYALTHLSASAYFVCFDAANVAGPSVTGYQDQCYKNKLWNGTAKPTAAAGDKLFGVSAATINIDGNLVPKP